MIHNTTMLLTGLVLYHPMIEIWSGTVRVSREDDLKDASTHLPPSALVSDGRKRLVRKDPLRPLLAVRKRVDRLLHTTGFPFMGGIAVPESACAAIEAELPDMEHTFIRALDDLCVNLATEYQLLREQYPDWSEMLKVSELGEASVRSRCRFDVVSHRVAAPDPTVSPTAANRFSKIANAALPSLLEDIAGDAEAMYRDSFKGKGRIAAKTAAMVVRMVDKLSAFGFLDPRVAPMAASLTAPLSNLPQSGYLTPTETVSVAGVLLTLRDPERLLEQGAAAISTLPDTLFDSDDISPNDMFVNLDKSVESAVIPVPVPVPARSRIDEDSRYAVTF